MVVLDTDLLSLLERDGREAATLRQRLRGVEVGTVVTTIVNFEEQMHGWLVVVARARTMARQIRNYDHPHLARSSSLVKLRFGLCAILTDAR